MKKSFLKTISLALVMIFTLMQNSVLASTPASAAETTPSDHPRRIIAYFCEWGNQELKGYYTVDKIPWDKITHINYAFAKVNSQNKIDFIDRAAAIEKDFPGQLTNLSYKGNFNLLTKYKQLYPDVKTLISVGGWSETTGFYTMCETAQGREAFANSVVDFLRQYNFNGVDIDYEYPTSTAQAGNPKDFPIAESRRATLYKNYVELMKLLRQKLDAASAQDGTKYLLTCAATASSWVLGGMELGEYAQYLDFANLMTYDFHGAWNGYVGHNAALYPDARDPETAALGVPVLNIDWAYRYYRGVLTPDKINIGVPYYSRGWKNVNKGTLPGGLYGSAAQTGGGADGIDGIWNDPAPEQPSGTNPIWHMKTLENTAGYQRYWDDVSKVPYLWNESKRVFLSYEDEQSIGEKVQYIIDKGLGGMMIWELSGDFDKKSDGTYGVGYTLTTLAYNKFKTASPSGPPPKPALPPAKDFKLTFGGKYDHPNYTYSLKITNNTGENIPGGWKLEFDMPKTCTFTSCWSGTVSGPVQSPYDADFNRYTITGPTYLSIANNSTVELQGMIKLCFSGGPQRVVLNGASSLAENPSQNNNVPAPASLTVDQNPNNGTYTVSAIVPAGNTATSLALYEGSTAVKTAAVTPNSSTAQTVNYPVSNKPVGSYVYRADLTNAYGTTSSANLSVTVQPATVETVATPTFSPAGGTYTAVQNVTLSCATAGATIRYTTNGTEPTASSAQYTGAISVAVTSTLKAKAFKSGMNDSATASATYTINGTVETVAAPVFSPAGGTYAAAQSVTLSSATAGAAIRYTTNGSEPTASSAQYTGAINVAATTTIKAKAFKSGMNDSATTSATYTINTVGQPGPWAVGTAYKAGDLVTYGGKTYKCLQPHTALAGWEPPNVPALWKEQ